MPTLDEIPDTVKRSAAPKADRPLIEFSGYDYTEFDGLPIEYYQAKRAKGHKIPRQISAEDQVRLTAILPDRNLQTLVARVAESQEQGRLTVLLSSGQFIQNAKSAEGRPMMRIHSREVDRDHIRVCMAMDEAAGYSLHPSRLTFGPTTDRAFMDRFRTLWTEEYESRNRAQAAPVASQKPATSPSRAPAAV